MRHRYVLAAAALAFGCARGPNVTTDQLPLKRVVVYRNGVGYFERAGSVDTDQVTFKMRGRMVGDFLATLAIVERGGSSVRSASFPLDIDDGEEEPELDPALRSMLKPWPQPEPKKRDPDDLQEVVLSLDGKRHDLAVGYVAVTPVWRPSYRLVIREDGSADLQAWGIVQNLSGEDWNNVRLALVAGAPLAFESTLGDPVLPQRPIVTDTGEVIAAVPESVTTLNEQLTEDEEDAGEGGEDEDAEPEEVANALKKEYQKTARTRGRKGGKKDKKKRPPRTAALSGAAGPAPPGDLGIETARDARREVERRLREGISRPRNLSALAAVAVEAGTTRYEIPTRVTVPDESATMVLLVSKSVPGEAVFLFAPDGGVPDSSAHPFRVARFTNSTKGLLERGPIAVFEKGSFLGQGMVDPLPPSAKATVPFALERSLAVQSERKYAEEGARVARIESGELFIERDSVTKTTYTLKNGSDRPAKMLVKHSRAHGTRLFEPPAGTEDNVGTGAALVPITIKPHSKTKLVVDERRAQERRESWLSNRADDAVKAFLADRRSPADAVAKLTAAWKIRVTLKAHVDERQKLVEEQAELERMTRETRLSLKAIEKNTQAADLRQRLTKRLKEGTSRLEQITKRLIEIKIVISEQEVRFQEALRSIKVTKPPPPPRGK